MARLPRCGPLPDALVRDAFAAVKRGDGAENAGDLPLVDVEIFLDGFGREERAGASRGARHFFEALLQRVSNAHGDGCGARRIHNVLHCITGGVTRHEGSRNYSPIPSHIPRISRMNDRLDSRNEFNSFE
jgi:hypothetical protein